MGKVIIQDYTTKTPISMIGAEAGYCWGADTTDQMWENEIGNMLMAIADIARLKKLPLEQILADRTDDFIERCEG